MKILVFRFSAMGDVALTVPCLRRIIQNNPNVEIYFLSKKTFTPFFFGIPRFTFIPVDFHKYQGLLGLFRLFKELEVANTFDLVIDLHSSLRSRILCFFFSLNKIPFFRIDKGNSDKRKAIRKKHKLLKTLPSTIQRYVDVFSKAGLSVGNDLNPNDFTWQGIYVDTEPNVNTETHVNTEPHVDINKPVFNGNLLEGGTTVHDQVFIGWAPFAGYALKEMPLLKQVSIVHKILRFFPNYHIILFASKNQQGSLAPFYNGFNTNCQEPEKNRILLAKDLTKDLSEELALIKMLKIMVSMDSANLHLAALVGTPVLGIYGPTHPYLGFRPFGQEFSGTYGIENLACRPCSVYGKGKCYRGDFACMNWIDEEVILNKIIND